MAASIWHIPAWTFGPVGLAGGGQSIHRNLSRIVGMHSRQTFPGIKTRGLMLRRGGSIRRPEYYHVPMYDPDPTWKFVKE